MKVRFKCDAELFLIIVNKHILIILKFKLLNFIFFFGVKDEKNPDIQKINIQFHTSIRAEIAGRSLEGFGNGFLWI